MNWLKHKLKNLIITLLGIALVLVWWTLRGPAKDPNHTIQETKIPEMYWEGGNHVLTIDASTTTDSTVSLSLQSPKPGGKPDESRWQEAFEPMAPGAKTWTVHFPDNTQFGTAELEAKNPKVGDKISWSILLDGQMIQQDEYVLDKPLEPNTAMFLQISLEDFLKPADDPSLDPSNPPDNNTEEPPAENPDGSQI